MSGVGDGLLGSGFCRLLGRRTGYRAGRTADGHRLSDDLASGTPYFKRHRTTFGMTVAHMVTWTR